MNSENLIYGFEHWMELHDLENTIEDNMVEVPEGVVTVGEKEYQVGRFKISRTLVSESFWGNVIGCEEAFSRRPVTDVPLTKISDFLQRLRVLRKIPGYWTIPTEAQLLLAQDGFILPSQKHKEVCLTQFQAPSEMGDHHYFGNLPQKDPFDLVVRHGVDREPLSYKMSAKDTGFRLVLVDYYMTRRRVSAAISSALSFSEFYPDYRIDGEGCHLFFEYSGNSAIACPSSLHNALLMVYPDKDKGDTIVVSTDIVRLPQDMDPDTIKARLIRMNADSKESGIRYEAPWLNHADEGQDRVLYVIKEIQAFSDINVMAVLPGMINKILDTTGAFMKRFDDAK